MARLVDVGGALLLLLLFSAAVLVAGSLQEGARRAPTPWRQLTNVVHFAPPQRVGAGLAACIALLAVLGTLVVALDVEETVLRLNEEQSIPAYFAALLLFAAGATGLLLWWQEGRSAIWAGLALCLFAVGIDEAAELHERIEVRTGLPALLILAPIGLVGGIAAIRAIPTLRANPPAFTLFAAGAFAWLLSLAIDPWHAKWKSVAEELLEMTGSALVLVALLFVAHGRRPGA